MTVHSTKRRRSAKDDSAIDENTEPCRPYEAEPSSDAGLVASLPTGASIKSSLPRTTPRAMLFPIGGDSPFMQLQLEALIEHAHLKRDHSPNLEPTLRALKKVIENLPHREPLSVSDSERAEDFLNGVRIPFPLSRPQDELRYKLAYDKPSKIEVVGSYAQETATRTHEPLVVDLAVKMPSSIFQAKDYKDYRYFHRRAYYLACIATGVRKAFRNEFDVEYCYKDDNLLQPVLLVRSKDIHSGDKSVERLLQIRIILCADLALFPLDKTLPGRQWLREVADLSSENARRKAYYVHNATIRSECLIFYFEHLLHDISAQSNAFRATCMLGSIWLRQRAFDSSMSGGGFGLFEWSITLALLLSRDDGRTALSLSMDLTPWQMFRAVLRFLATTDLCAAPFIIPSASSQTQVNIEGSEGPVLFDTAVGLNVLFKMSPWSYENLKRHALRCMRLQADPIVDQLESNFILRIDRRANKHDIGIQIRLREMPADNRSVTSAVSQSHQRLNRLYSVLRKGLGDRVLSIDLQYAPKRTWRIESATSSHVDVGDVFIGLVVNGTSANRTIDKGPSASDSVAAADFRRFWGDKAELRLFKDGSTLEVVDWSCCTHKQHIILQIVKHLTRVHLNEEVATPIETSWDHSDAPLSQLNFDLRKDEAAFQTLYTSFQDLEKHIRGLEGLPLHVRQISAADSQLCAMSTCAPSCDNGSILRPSANVIIQFESSSRWPDDFDALQRSKIALLLKIGNLVETSYIGVTAHLGLENDSQALHNVSFLDVVHATGAAFRLRIQVPSEEALIKNELERAGPSTLEKEAAASALATYRRNFVQKPVYTQAMRAMIMRFPSFPSAVRIMKKWRDCHLLSNHLGDEMIELLVLHNFIHPGPNDPPRSAMIGFFRTLAYVSRWDWRTRPLIVDFNGELKPEDVKAITTRLEAWRIVDPAMNKVAMFVASNIDCEGNTWTQSNPSIVAAARLTSLTKAATTLIGKQVQNLQLRAIFMPDLKEYDFLIHLASGQIPAEGEKTANFKNIRVQEEIQTNNDRSSRVEFLFKEIQRLFGSSATLFYGEGSEVIGGLFNPNLKPRPWKVHLGFSSVPLEDSDKDRGKVKLNQDGIMNEIARLGQGMIRAIEMKK